MHTQNAATDYNMAQANEDSAIQGYDSLINKYANPAIPAEELYWYEENAEGGITILGPKKVLYFDSNKADEKVGEIIDAEYGAGTTESLNNGSIDEGSELFYEIAIKAELEASKLFFDYSANNECWIARDITKEEVNTHWWVNNLDGDVRLYNNEKLPEYIDGKPVTEIGDYAFYEVYVINGAFIPNTVTHIGVEAFRNSLFESQLIIPDSVERIEKRAFVDLNSKPNFELGWNEETGLEYEDITLIINDAKGALKYIGSSAFSFDKNNDILIGTLNLRSEIEIASNAFGQRVTVNRK